MVEADIPWDHSQVEEFGKEFEPWTQEDLSNALLAVRKALPNHKLAVVVRLMLC